MPELTRSSIKMLTVVAQFGSDNAKQSSREILDKFGTDELPALLEQKRKMSGSFMKAVLEGDYLEAIILADLENRYALITLLDK